MPGDVLNRSRVSHGKPTRRSGRWHCRARTQMAHAILTGALALSFAPGSTAQTKANTTANAAVNAPAVTAPASIQQGNTAQDTSEQDLIRVRQAFLARFPGVPLNGVAITPFAGVYELHVDQDLLYTDAQVNYLMQGSLIDAQSRTDLTARRLQVLNRVEFASLPLELAIKQVHGSGKHRIVVFEDPNCRYCKLLHQTLAQMDDVTIYTFLFPILSEDSAVKARDIWCAPNRVQVWQDWMRNGQVPATAQCTTPIPTLLALGRDLRIQGTPALFFTDGSRISGALPLELLQDKLNQVERDAQNG